MDKKSWKRDIFKMLEKINVKIIPCDIRCERKKCCSNSLKACAEKSTVYQSI